MYYLYYQFEYERPYFFKFYIKKYFIYTNYYIIPLYFDEIRPNPFINNNKPCFELAV